MRTLGLYAEDFAGLSAGILDQGGTFCFRARGSSMVPFLHDGDLLTVQPTEAADLRVGDVAFYQTDGGRLAVHRVVARRRQGAGAVLIIRGDAAPGPGEPVPPDQVLGRVVRLQRAGRIHDLDRSAPRLAARLWIATVPLGPWLVGGVGALNQLAGRLRISVLVL